MRRKDVLAIDRIIKYAKKEFLEKGFEGASMRAIAENAGYSTGMLYSRFNDKRELFDAITKESAERLYQYYVNTQKEFADFPPEVQYREMHMYVDSKIDEMIDIIYDNFDEYKLIICKNKGSTYENYIEKLIDIETESTIRFINNMNKAGIKVNKIRDDVFHILTTAMFNGIFEVVEHDFTKDNAKQYIMQLQMFFNAGWDKILGLKPDNAKK